MPEEITRITMAKVNMVWELQSQTQEESDALLTSQRDALQIRAATAGRGVGCIMAHGIV